MTTETVIGRVRFFSHRAALWLTAFISIIAAPPTFAESGITDPFQLAQADKLNELITVLRR